MSLKITVRIEDEAVRRMVRRAPEAIRMKAIGQGLARICERVVDQAKLNLIKNRSRFTGALSQSLAFKVDVPRGLAFVGALKNPKATGSRDGPRDYGFYVEHGRRPGRVPAPALLKLWVRRKLGVANEKAAARATFFVLRKIRRQGIKAAPFLEPAVDSVRPRASQIMERELNRQLRRFR